MTAVASFCGVAVMGFAFAAATDQSATSHDGTVVSAGMGALAMKDDQGKEHRHKIDESVEITVNGKPAVLDDLKAGMKIRVTMDKDNRVLSVSTRDDEK